MKIRVFFRSPEVPGRWSGKGIVLTVFIVPRVIGGRFKKAREIGPKTAGEFYQRGPLLFPSESIQSCPVIGRDLCTFLSREFIDGRCVILRTSPKDRTRKLPLIWSVGIVLRLEAEPI